jgi:hypothetical protein
MIRKVGHYRFLESFDLLFQSQILGCVGEIKALLGEPKIREGVVAYSEGDAKFLVLSESVADNDLQSVLDLRPQFAYLIRSVPPGNAASPLKQYPARTPRPALVNSK